jgi:hypothetical protein
MLSCAEKPQASINMNKSLRHLFLLCLLLQLGGCSFAELTVRASMPMIEGGMLAVNREDDLLLAEAAMPANIELMEGMLINAPDHRELRNYAAQAYYGYAYGFIEDQQPQRAAKLYRRGLNHALYNLHDQGISQAVLNGPLTELEQQLEQLNKKSVPALFWAASNWAKWIDHHRNQAEAIAQLPRAVLLMQRVLQLDENFYYAGPHLFFAVYHGSRSPMLGGNFELSAQHFDKARQLNSQPLLMIDLLQAEYLHRQMFDQQAFHSRLSKLVEQDVSAATDLALINNIAKRKAQRLLEKEAEWF